MIWWVCLLGTDTKTFAQREVNSAIVLRSEMKYKSVFFVPQLYHFVTKIFH
jgi:hypothetical protein